MNTKVKDTINRLLNISKKKLTIIGIIIAVIVLIIVFLQMSKTSNISDKEVFIYPNMKYEDVIKTLKQDSIINGSGGAFSFYSKMLNYKKHIKPGRYVVEKNTSTLLLVRKLRSGNQTPVKLVITTARTEEDFANKICKNLMMDDSTLVNEIKKEYPLYPTLFFVDIIPNTYEVYWTISPNELILKLKKEANKFWKENKQKLKLSGFSRKDIVCLASIVNEETNKNDEKSRIAGVYVNRLHRNMPLQADPTIKFALKDFSLKRIKSEHLGVDSPFNTYKNIGLVPAPICLPSIESIQATLKYERHNYIYFCAKEDFSGYHNFATNARDHINNANRYHRALNSILN